MQYFLIKYRYLECSVFTFVQYMNVTEGRTSLPRETIGPIGSNCFSRVGPYQFLRKPITTRVFRMGGSGQHNSGNNSEIHVRL